METQGVNRLTESGGQITLREVYGLIEGVRKELLSEMKSLDTTVHSSLTAHQAEHSLHEERHQRESSARNALMRWAVTSLLTGIGVLIAIYVALRN
jgi:hypothetical protein